MQKCIFFAFSPVSKYRKKGRRPRNGNGSQRLFWGARDNKDVSVSLQKNRQNSLYYNGDISSSEFLICLLDKLSERFRKNKRCIKGIVGK